MISRENYDLGAADATIDRKDGDIWTLVLVRDLRHSPEKVWQALTDPAQLREWAPFDANTNLGTPGPVQLATVGAPKPHVTETEITRAEAPKLLEYKWGGGDIRWELEAAGQGTRLTLWSSIGSKFVAMGAAGWHVCLEVLDRLLDGKPVGRIVGPDALQFDEWQRLNKEYSERFGVDVLSW